MASFASLLAFLLAATLAAGVCAEHLIVGNLDSGSKTIYQENVAEEFAITGQKVVIDRKIDAPEGHVITQVKLLDQATDGTGAEASIVGGGPGDTFVRIKFKSQRFRGVYFDVEVFAKQYR